MDLATIYELNRRELYLFLILSYNIIFLYLTREIKINTMWKALIFTIGKIVSWLFVALFPLYYYFFTLPGADFDIFMKLIFFFYSLFFILMALTFNLWTFEFLSKIVYKMTGYDIRKKLHHYRSQEWK